MDILDFDYFRSRSVVPEICIWLNYLLFQTHTDNACSKNILQRFSNSKRTANRHLVTDVVLFGKNDNVNSIF